MREAVRVLDRLRAKGEEIFAQVSAELMSNPRFVKALEAAWKGKAKLDAAVAQGLKTANLPTRTEFKKALRRVEALEAQVEELKAALAKARAPAGRRRAAGKGAAGRRAARPVSGGRAPAGGGAGGPAAPVEAGAAAPEE